MSVLIPPSFLAQQILEAEEQAGRVYEAVIGLVVDNKDPEKLGRIKVRFPTLPGQSDTSTWATISSLGAGKDRGWFFLPEIDDEVLVMFEHGEIRRPVVLGALWNGVDKPPEKNGGGNERRVIVSRGGSRIEFDDDGGTVTLEDGGGKGKIVLSADGKVTLEAPTDDVGIQAPGGELKVVAKDIVLEATESVKLQSGEGMNLKAGASGTVRAPMIVIASGTTGVNAGGGGDASSASASAEEVPDPVGK